MRFSLSIENGNEVPPTNTYKTPDNRTVAVYDPSAENFPDPGEKVTPTEGEPFLESPPNEVKRYCSININFDVFELLLFK